MESESPEDGTASSYRPKNTDLEETRPSRIVIVTEDERLFAADNFRIFLSAIQRDCRAVLAVLGDFSPAGSRLSRVATVSYLWKTFGPAAFIGVGLQYLRHLVDRSKGVQRVFRQFDVPVFHARGDVNSEPVVRAIRAAKPDMIVSISMNRLFGSRLLDIAPCLNLHLSLLPRHGGLMPVFWALHDGDREAGVTVFRVNDGIDDGEILAQRRVPIQTRRLLPLYRELKKIGMQALAEAVRSDGQTDLSQAMPEIGDTSVNRKPTRKDVDRFRLAGNRIF